MSAMPPTNRQAGISIVEMLTVLTLIPLVLAFFISAIFTTLIAAQRSKVQLALDSTVQTAMDIVERDVRFAKSFKKGVASPFSDHYGANNNGTDDAEAWSHAGVPAGANQRALLLQLPATSQSPSSNARTPVFTDSGEFNCTTERTYNPELAYMVVYFVRGETLWRRTLTDTTTPLCAGQAQNQRQSCPPEIASPHGSCQARDERIAGNVSQFSVAYYTALVPSAIADAYSSSDPDILTNADDAEVTLTSSAPFASETLSATMTLRIGRANAS